MSRLLTGMIVLSVLLGGTANAQIPGQLKRKAKQALKGKLGKDSQELKKPQAGDQSRSRPPARKDKDRKYPPGLSFSSVLNGVKLLPENGKFSLHQIQTTFLPNDCEAGFTVLRTADGKEIFQWDWKPDRLKKPYALMSVHERTDLKTGKRQSAGFVDMRTPGDYVLDFYLPTEHFYSFPFSVVKIGSDDAFGPGDCYVLDGDWENWAYLYYQGAKADQSLHWKVWLRNKAAEPVDVKIRVEVTRDADSELVCTSRGTTTYTLTPAWVRYDFDLIFPKELEGGGAYFKAKDLLKTDGAYTLVMKINDELYGTWKFTIEGNKLKYAGRALRGEANPLTFIEGGKDAWWYAREKK